METYTRYDIIPLRAVSWCASTGEACEWQYANSSRPSFSECSEDLPRGADEDHPAIGAVQQQFGSVVAIIDETKQKNGLSAVVAIDFTIETCGICGCAGQITQATYELQCRRDTKEEKEYHEFLCSDCMKTLPSDGVFSQSDYERI